MSIINREQQRIQLYYEEVRQLLEQGNIKEANNILFKSMPKELYDLSLDILVNNNGEFSNNQLRVLIREVDKMLGNDDIEYPLNNKDYLTNTIEENE